MRVLLTGWTGLVGRSVAARLTGEGHRVVGLARGHGNGDEELAESISDDIGEPGLVARLGPHDSCQAIVHAAAVGPGPPDDPAVSLVNAFGTHQLIELAYRWGVESLIFLSSLPLVGRPTQLPVTEEHPVCPGTAYYASKRYGEQLVELAAGDGIAAVSLRLTSPIGPGMPPGRVLPVFVSRALAGEPLELHGRGTRCQDYVDVGDVAAAVAAALQRAPTGVLNIASGRHISNLDLAHLCVRLLASGSEVSFSRAGDPEEGVCWQVSIDKAHRVLGYRPAQTLEDSILAIAASMR